MRQAQRGPAAAETRRFPQLSPDVEGASRIHNSLLTCEKFGARDVKAGFALSRSTICSWASILSSSLQLT